MSSVYREPSGTLKAFRAYESGKTLPLPRALLSTKVSSCPIRDTLGARARLSSADTRECDELRGPAAAPWSLRASGAGGDAEPARRGPALVDTGILSALRCNAERKMLSLKTEMREMEFANSIRKHRAWKRLLLTAGSGTDASQPL
ncbi:hypothetical protein NDU88_006747 [Pleurodeles waltl]|uniref:Uncharacterized protein n=1 Tax=Pleurodeles waltl TaxID=8319 RepID=A0AAV7WBN1_PLEWA|nr:hypothetical protein NDU88_006747 [Pleurodeles waltl]